MELLLKLRSMQPHSATSALPFSKSVASSLHVVLLAQVCQFEKCFCFSETVTVILKDRLSLCTVTSISKYSRQVQ